MKKILGLLVAFCLFSSLAACQPSLPSGAMLSDVQRKAVLAFTEPQMENLLDGWNADNYDVFSKNFDPDLLKSMTRQEFEKLNTDALTGLGRFYSREVESVVERDDGSYTVIYYGVFENDDEVLMRVTFQGDEPHRINKLSFEK
jgi:hypothetical protein